MMWLPYDFLQPGLDLRRLLLQLDARLLGGIGYVQPPTVTVPSCA
jgi:hypothetical protein